MYIYIYTMQLDYSQLLEISVWSPVSTEDPPWNAQELQGLDAVLVDPAKAKLETTERQLAAKIELQDALAIRGLAIMEESPEDAVFALTTISHFFKFELVWKIGRPKKYHLVQNFPVNYSYPLVI